MGRQTRKQDESMIQHFGCYCVCWDDTTIWDAKMYSVLQAWGTGSYFKLGFFSGNVSRLFYVSLMWSWECTLCFMMWSYQSLNLLLKTLLLCYGHHLCLFLKLKYSFHMNHYPETLTLSTQHSAYSSEKTGGCCKPRKWRCLVHSG